MVESNFNFIKLPNSMEIYNESQFIIDDTSPVHLQGSYAIPANRLASGSYKTFTSYCVKHLHKTATIQPTREKNVNHKSDHRFTLSDIDCQAHGLFLSI